MHARRLQYSACTWSEEACVRTCLAGEKFHKYHRLGFRLVSSRWSHCLFTTASHQSAKQSEHTDTGFFFLLSCITKYDWGFHARFFFLLYFSFLFLLHLPASLSLATLDTSHSPRYRNVTFDLVDIHGIKNKTVKYFVNELRTRRLKSGLRWCNTEM